MTPHRSLPAVLAVLTLLIGAPPATAHRPDNTDPGNPEPPAVSEDFTKTVLTTGLANPFEVIYGPDEKLWVTERTAGRVTQVDPTTGAKTTILTIDEVVATPGEQDGLLGMALHPELLEDGDNPYVYLSYTYDADPAEDVLERRQRLVRYTYDQDQNVLGEPQELITGLPASDDHNSGRLVYGPDDSLYYTIGDRGNNQDSNFCRVIESQRLPTQQEVDEQDWTAYQGKTLRLNLDGSVPEDNPVLEGVRSHVNTYGHRNAQGLAFGDRGRLYSSEQGPQTDDEINLIRSGGNYGWPQVAGFKDDSAYVYGNWSAAEGCGTTVAYDAFQFPAAVPQFPEHDFTAENFVQPLRTYYTVPSTFDFTPDACEGSGLWFICWPTIAPSSLEYYNHDTIAGWEDSLLMPTLKDGTVYRVEVTGHGETLGESQPLWRSVNRYRDTATSSDGATVFVATDSGGLARGTDGDATDQLENPGSILVFTYAGDQE